MRDLLRRLGRLRPAAATGLVIVLIASLAVAGVLAYQAITAARQQRAVSEAMLRQYAELAAWEFSRLARRNVDEALMHALAAYAHPGSVAAASSCNCGTLGSIEHSFDVRAAGEVITRGAALPSELHRHIAALPIASDRGGEGTLRIWRLPHDRTRLVAIKPEPHLGIAGGHVGLVATDASLAPVLERTYRRATLLPSMLVSSRDAHALVHLRVLAPTGEAIFASSGTVPGPHVMQTAFPADSALALVTEASMTPAFIAGLGPEHVGGPSVPLVLALVGVNAMLVIAGLWLLARERELARLRSNFVAGVSHELRTPLAQIRMFSETLLLNRVRNDGEKRRALEIIGHEATRLSQLVDNVLHFHRRPRNTDDGKRELIDLNAFARDVVESFEPLAASKRVRLALSHDNEDRPVHGDAGGLRQVVLNLLDNAVKFGPADQLVTVHLQSRDDLVMLSVEDNGPGVALRERQRIFKPFERGRRTNGSGGAGIGLAVVHRIVSAHRGEITVENVESGGARFTVTLPLAGATE